VNNVCVDFLTVKN